jgi:transposase
MYQRKSRLSNYKQQRLIEHFVAGATARAAAEIVGVQPNTSATFFLRLRKLIAGKLPNYEICSEIRIDDYGDRMPRKSKYGIFAPKLKLELVFGFLERDGKIHIAIAPDTKAGTSLLVNPQTVRPDIIVYTDVPFTDKALDMGDFHHTRTSNTTPVGTTEPNFTGIENFWIQSKRYLRRFNGIKPTHFYWFLKECEWRFNDSNRKQLLTEIKKWAREAQ